MKRRRLGGGNIALDPTQRSPESVDKGIEAMKTKLREEQEMKVDNGDVGGRCPDAPEE